MANWSGARILVVRLSSLGDVARLLPALRALGGEGLERLDVAVEDRFASLLGLFPLADRVIEYPRRVPGPPWRHPCRWVSAMRAFREELLRGRYDLALDMHGLLRSALVARMSRARHTAGFARGFGKEGSHLLYDMPVVPGPSRRMSRFERYAGTLAVLGFSRPDGSFFVPSLPEKAKEDVGHFLAESGLSPKNYVFSFMGTSRAQAFKRWPAVRFVELSALIWDRFGVPTVLGWGPDEADAARSVAGPHLKAVPDWDLPRLLSCIAGAAGFVGADTGATHLSALMGTPTVALLGPTDPVLNAPFGPRAHVVYREGVRRACGGASCAHGDCMGAIEAATVAEALTGLLAEAPSPESRT